MCDYRRFLWKNDDIIILLNDDSADPTELLNATALQLINEFTVSVSCTALRTDDLNKPLDMIFPYPLRSSKRFDPTCRLSVATPDCESWKKVKNLIESSKTLVSLQKPLLSDLVLFYTFHLVQNGRPLSPSKVTVLTKSDLSRTLFSNVLTLPSTEMADHNFKSLETPLLLMRQVSQLARIYRVLYGTAVLRNVICPDIHQVILSADNRILRSTVVIFEHFPEFLLTEWRKCLAEENSDFFLSAFLLSDWRIPINSQLVVHPCGHLHPGNCLYVAVEGISSVLAKIYLSDGDLMIEPHYRLVKVNFDLVDAERKIYCGDIISVGDVHYFVVCGGDDDWGSRSRETIRQKFLSEDTRKVGDETFIDCVVRKSINMGELMVTLPIPFRGWIPSVSLPLQIVTKSIQLATCLFHMSSLCQNGVYVGHVVGSESEIVGECHISIKHGENYFDDFDNYIQYSLTIKSITFSIPIKSHVVYVLYDSQFLRINSSKTFSSSNAVAILVEVQTVQKESEPIHRLIQSMSSFKLGVEIIQQGSPVPIISGGLFQLVQGYQNTLRVRVLPLPIGTIPILNIKVSHVSVGAAKVIKVSQMDNSVGEEPEELFRRIDKKIVEKTEDIGIVSRLTALKEYLTETDYMTVLQEKFSNILGPGYEKSHQIIFPSLTSVFLPESDSVLCSLESKEIFSRITEKSTCFSISLFVQLVVETTRGSFIVDAEKELLVQVLPSPIPFFKLKLLNPYFESAKVFHLISEIFAPFGPIPLGEFSSRFGEFSECVTFLVYMLQRDREYQSLQSSAERPSALAEATSAVIGKITKSNYFSTTFQRKSLDSFKSKINNVLGRLSTSSSSNVPNLMINPYGSKQSSISSSTPKLSEENPLNEIYESAPVWDSSGEEEDALGDLDMLGDIFSNDEEDLVDDRMTVPEWIRNGTSVRLRGMCCGVVRYIGKTHFGSSLTVGVELENALGDCNGTYEGVVYFKCRNNHGIFVSPNNIEGL